MAQPTTYTRQNSFTLIAQVSPSTPYTGTQLDAEFNAVKVTLDELLANIALLQRDDGFLGNQTVGPDQLAASLNLGVNSPTAWATATAYSLYATVFNGTSLYKATVAHTSVAAFATDLAAGKWSLLADFNTIAIGDGAITTAKLADGAATSIKIANNGVTTTKITDLNVTTAKLADLAVTVGKLAANAVATAKIQDAAVETVKIADANVTTAKLADASVTNAKLANVATATFKGRTTAATGVPEDLTATQATALLDAVVGDSGAGGTKGLVPAPGVGDAAASKFLKADGTFAKTPFASQLLHVRDEKTAGTNGGDSTSGSWQTRTLNTSKTNEITGASLGSNQITLPAGTYYCQASAPIYNTVSAQAKLYNVTDAADILIGLSLVPSPTGSSSCVVCGRFTLAAQKVVELRSRTHDSNTNGLGVAANFGVTEVYSEVLIWKVA